MVMVGSSLNRDQSTGLELTGINQGLQGHPPFSSSQRALLPLLHRPHHVHPKTLTLGLQELYRYLMPNINTKVCIGLVILLVFFSGVVFYVLNIFLSSKIHLVEVLTPNVVVPGDWL